MIAPLVMGGIMAGAGLLNNIFSSKKPQVTRQGELDPQSQAYILAQRERATGYANQPMPGLDPAFLQALRGVQDYGAAGKMGLDAQTDPAMAARFMNPGAMAMNPVFDRQRASATNDYNKAATQSGVFGARRGLGPNLNSINDAQAQMQYRGFNDAMSRAMQLAGMGMGANQWMGNVGQYMTDRQRNYDQGSLNMIQQGYGGPLYTQSTSPNDKGNPFQAALGGFATGMSFGGGGAPKIAPTGGGYQFDPNDPSHYWNNDPNAGMGAGY